MSIDLSWFLYLYDVTLSVVVLQACRARSGKHGHEACPDIHLEALLDPREKRPIRAQSSRELLRRHESPVEFEQPAKLSGC